MVRGFRFGAKELLAEQDTSCFEPMGDLVEPDPAGDGLFVVGAFEVEGHLGFVEVDLRQADLLLQPRLSIDDESQDDVLDGVVLEVVLVLRPVQVGQRVRDEAGGLGKHETLHFSVGTAQLCKKAIIRSCCEFDIVIPIILSYVNVTSVIFIYSKSI